MKQLIIILIFAVIFTSVSNSMDQSRMRVIQTMIDSSRTQADLNLASKMLFELWSDEVRQKELEVMRIIPKKFGKKFRTSMKYWRKHVESMSILRSELFKRDFMEPRYYKLRGIESKVSSLKTAKNMQPYVYNMSRSIYYEEKWIELDILLNTK